MNAWLRSTRAFAAFEAWRVPSNALLALIKEFPRGIAPLQQGFRPVELLLREGLLRLQLRDIRLSLQDRMFILTHQRFIFSELGFKIACVHASDDLTGLHHVAFIDKKLEDTACKFRLDVDFLRHRFGRCSRQSCGQKILVLAPPIPAAGRAGCPAD